MKEVVLIWLLVLGSFLWGSYITYQDMHKRAYSLCESSWKSAAFETHIILGIKYKDRTIDKERQKMKEYCDWRVHL